MFLKLWKFFWIRWLWCKLCDILDIIFNKMNFDSTLSQAFFFFLAILSLHFCFDFCQIGADMSLLVQHLIPFGLRGLWFFWSFLAYFHFWFHFDSQFVKSFLLMSNSYAEYAEHLHFFKKNHLRYDTSLVTAVSVVLKSKFFDVKTMIKERFTV